MDRNDNRTYFHHAQIVVPRKGDVDRNVDPCNGGSDRPVVPRKGDVDRNPRLHTGQSTA